MSQETRPTIPSYSLYGEAGHFPDLLHCENIRARAALHDWNIGAHRHARLHQFLLVEQGGGVAHVEAHRLRMQPATVLNLPPTHVHAFEFEPGTEGWVITVPVEMLENTIGTGTPLYRWLASPGHGAAGDDLIAAFSRIANEHAASAPGRAVMLRAGAALLAGYVARAMSDAESPPAPAAAQGLMNRFDNLVEQHYREHWAVAEFARHLGVSATHLGRVARHSRGISAARLVEARRMREAQRLLAYTSIQVQQIAFELGYEDPAYFSRAFRRHAGMAPNRYRSRLAGFNPR